MARQPVALSPWPMWVLGFVTAIDQADQNILRGVEGLLRDDFGLSKGAVGLLASAFVLVNALTVVPAGYLADRWNRKNAIGNTIILWSAITTITALCQNFGQLLFVRAMLGFGQGISEPSAGALISDYYPLEQRGKAFSNQQVMFFVGAGLGLGLGGAIGEAFGWRWAFVAVGAPGALISMLVWRLREPKRGFGDRVSLGLETEIEENTEKVELFEHGFRVFARDMVKGLRDDFKTILAIPTLKYSMIGVGALLFTVTGIAFWLPEFYVQYHAQTLTRATAIVGFVLGAGGIAGTLIGGRIADKWTNRIRGARLAIPAWGLMIGSVVFLPSWLPMPLAFDLAIQLVGMLVVTICIPALRAGLADAVPAHLRGAGFAAFTLVATVFGAAAAPPVIGLLADVINLRVAFIICTPPIFIGGLVLLRARDHLDEDVAKIMLAVQQAYTAQMDEEEHRRAGIATGTAASDAIDEAAGSATVEGAIVADAVQSD